MIKARLANREGAFVFVVYSAAPDPGHTGLWARFRMNASGLRAGPLIDSQAFMKKARTDACET